MGDSDPGGQYEGKEAGATSRSQMFENGLSVSEGRWNCERTVCRPERQEHLTECACIDVLDPGTPLPSLHGSLLPPGPLPPPPKPSLKRAPSALAQKSGREAHRRPRNTLL